MVAYSVSERGTLILSEEALTKWKRQLYNPM